MGNSSSSINTSVGADTSNLFDDFDEKGSRGIYVISRRLASKGNWKDAYRSRSRKDACGNAHKNPVPREGRPVPTFHWGVLVGGWVYELVLKPGENNIISHRADPFAASEWETILYIGQTIMTDEELEAKGRSIISQMPKRYHTFLNDCQTFVRNLLPEIALEIPSKD
ncbi:hypothetical protein DFH09DRAFT_1147373 [Mycena vulgaris]|nr:hypothetical protein DFH09DRAFT_1147373 [Mycena vulgaris]